MSQLATGSLAAFSRPSTPSPVVTLTIAVAIPSSPRCSAMAIAVPTTSAPAMSCVRSSRHWRATFHLTRVPRRRYQGHVSSRSRWVTILRARPGQTTSVAEYSQALKRTTCTRGTTSASGGWRASISRSMCSSKNDLPIPHEPKMPIVSGGWVWGEAMRSANAWTYAVKPSWSTLPTLSLPAPASVPVAGGAGSAAGRTRAMAAIP